jgi:hypothetical protein
MPAPLGEGLVFNLYRRSPQPLKAPNCALDVQSIAIACVGINDHRQANAFANAPHDVSNLIKPDKPNVWASKLCIGNRRA